MYGGKELDIDSVKIHDKELRVIRRLKVSAHKTKLVSRSSIEMNEIRELLINNFFAFSFDPFFLWLYIGLYTESTISLSLFSRG